MEARHANRNAQIIPSLFLTDLILACG